MHYDNPLGIEGLVDSTTVKFHIDHLLRPNDAALLILGSPKDHISLPPGESDYTIGFQCPPVATANDPYANERKLEELIGSGPPLNVLYHAPHMHLYGSKLWVEQYSQNGTLKRYLGATDPYFFDYQTVHDMPAELLGADTAATTWAQIEASDQLKTYCTYDTTTTPITIVGGDATDNEMCMQFLWCDHNSTIGPSRLSWAVAPVMLIE